MPGSSNNRKSGAQSFSTERLDLVPTSEQDAALVLAMLNSPKFIQFVGDREVRTEEAARDYINNKMVPQLTRLGYSNYTLLRKTDGEKLGCCGLYDREGLEGVDLGFALLPQFEGHGYAYEASVELIRAAKEDFGITVIKGITSKEHYVSQKLLQKLGMNQSGTVTLPDEDEELYVFELRL